MNPQEQRVRDDLAVLAESDRGRELLQLALRGIGRGDRAVTAGCWTDRGVAGCLFQHAYWQGVREGTFPAGVSARDWVSAYAGTAGYWNVTRTIAAFDELAREEFAGTQRRLLGRRSRPTDAWRGRVEALLIDALGATAPEPRPASTI
jgi:hypothetical protein